MHQEHGTITTDNYRAVLYSWGCLFGVPIRVPSPGGLGLSLEPRQNTPIKGHVMAAISWYLGQLNGWVRREGGAGFRLGAVFGSRPAYQPSGLLRGTCEPYCKKMGTSMYTFISFPLDSPSQIKILPHARLTVRCFLVLPGGA